MAGQIFLPLREAVAEVLRIEGLSLLDKPKAFRSCLLDVADQSRPDVSLLEQQLDASVDVLGFLSGAAQNPTDISLRTAQAQIRDVLENERFVKEDLASSVADGLVGGLADYLGVVWPPTNAAVQQGGNGFASASTAQAYSKAPKPAQAQVPKVAQGNNQRTHVSPPTSTAMRTKSTPTSVPAPTQAPRGSANQPVSQPTTPVQPKKKSSDLVVVLLVAVFAAIAVAVAVFVVNLKDERSGWEPIPSNTQPIIDAPVNAPTTTDEKTTSVVEDAKTSYVIASDTNFPPFESIADDGSFQGLEIDLLDAIAKDQGFSYEITSDSFDSLFNDVSSGKADGIMSALSVTDERKAYLDFSDVYYTDQYGGEDMPYAFAVKRGTNAKLLKMFNDGLANIKASGTYDEILKKYEKELATLS